MYIEKTDIELKELIGIVHLKRILKTSKEHKETRHQLRKYLKKRIDNYVFWGFRDQDKDIFIDEYSIEMLRTLAKEDIEYILANFKG